MPLYDFACPGCSNAFEELVRSSVFEATCPRCGGVARRSLGGAEAAPPPDTPSAHPRRAEIEAALAELRSAVPGGQLVDFWTGNPYLTPERRARLDQHHDRLAAVLDEALAHERFVPIALPDKRHPPDIELHLAWALVRAGATLAQYPAHAERNLDDEISTITLGAAYDQVVIYKGPLSLKGLVRIRGTVVVVGDLIIDGGLIDGEPSASALVVIGAERVTALYSNTDHLVTDDFRAELFVKPNEHSSFETGGARFAALSLTTGQGWEQPPKTERWCALDDSFDQQADPAALADSLAPPLTAAVDPWELFLDVAVGRRAVIVPAR